MSNGESIKLEVDMLDCWPLRMDETSNFIDMGTFLRRQAPDVDFLSLNKFYEVFDTTLILSPCSEQF